MRLVLLVSASLLASAALAHQGVQNPAVMARMMGMTAIADATKALSEIAKGQRPLAEAEAAWKSDEARLQAIKSKLEPRTRDPREMADLLSYELIDRPGKDEDILAT